MSARQENPKHKQGDGAGFGRLRAEQTKRSIFQQLLYRSHPSGGVHIDQVREYAGVQVCFYRHRMPGAACEQARIAVFEPSDNAERWNKVNDIIAAQE
jgi:hypothetical protein